MVPKRQSGLEIVHVSWFAHEAHLARSLLASEGIDAWVLDADQVGMQWHVASAVGGIKVGVRSEDAVRARNVLSEDYSSSLSGIDEVSLPAAAEERCPRCGSSATRSTKTTERPTPWSWVSMAFFFLFGLLVPRRRRLIRSCCAACGQFWSAHS